MYHKIPHLVTLDYGIFCPVKTQDMANFFFSRVLIFEGMRDVEKKIMFLF